MPRFATNWTYALLTDFSKDGEPAAWAANQPAFWGAEDFSIDIGERLLDGAFSHDEKFLALAFGNTLKIYNVLDFSVVEVLQAPGETLEQVEWQPRADHEDGYRILAALHPSMADESTVPVQVVIWTLDNAGRQKDLPQGEPADVQDLARVAQEQVTSLLISQYRWTEGQINEAEIRNGFIKVLESAAMERLIQNTTRVAGVPFSFGSRVFSHSGSSILVGSAENRGRKTVIEVWDVSVAIPVRRLSLSGHTDSVMWAGFNPDESVIASSCWDQTLKLWSARTGEMLHSLGPSGGQNWTGAFSPDGKLIAHGTGGRDKGVFIWNVETGEQVLTVAEIGKWVRALAWHPDGRFLAIGSRRGEVQIIDVRPSEDISRLPGTRVQHWQLDPGEDPLRNALAEISKLQWLDGGKKLVFWDSGTMSVEVYDIDNNLKWRFSPADVASYVSGNRGVAKALWWSSTRRLAILDIDSKVRFWSM